MREAPTNLALALARGSRQLDLDQYEVGLKAFGKEDPDNQEASQQDPNWLKS